MTAASEREIGTELSAALHESTGGFELIIGAIAAAGFGYLVDRAFGIFPVVTILFAVLGFAGAAISIYYRYRASMATADAARAARRDRNGDAAA